MAVLTTGTTAVVDLWLQLMLRTIQAAAALKRRLAGRQAESAAAVQVRWARLEAGWQSKGETDQLASSTATGCFVTASFLPPSPACLITAPFLPFTPAPFPPGPQRPSSTFTLSLPPSKNPKVNNQN